MLKALHIKILIGIVAALTAIGALLVHQNHIHEQSAADAAKSRQVLEQQQKAADSVKKDDEGMRKQVEANKKRHSAYDHDGSKTNSYIP